MLDDYNNRAGHIMPVMPPAHASFAAFGSVEHVLQQADLQVPWLFPALPEDFLSRLHELVNKYAKMQKWSNVSLSICRGIAAKTLDGLLTSKSRQHGSIVIDPTGSSPEYQKYDNYSQVQSAKDRLVRINEATNDVLIIMFGINDPDRSIIAELLMWRLQMMQATLEYVYEPKNNQSEPTGREWLIKDIMQQIMSTYALVGLVGSGASESILDRLDRTGNRAPGMLFYAITNLALLATMPIDPLMNADISGVRYALEMLPNSMSQKIMSDIPELSLKNLSSAVKDLYTNPRYENNANVAKIAPDNALKTANPKLAAPEIAPSAN